MKHPVLSTVVVAGVVGVTSAVVTTMLVSPSGERAQAAPASATDDRLLAELRELADETKRLRERMDAFEARPVAPPLAARTSIEATALDPSFEEEVRAWMAAMERDGEVPADLVDSVEDALDRIREEEELEEERLEEERRLARQEERLLRLTSELELSQHQVGELRTLWTTYDATRDELKELYEQNGDREAYREARRALRDENESTLARLLTPEQLAGYEERENRDRRREVSVEDVQRLRQLDRARRRDR